MSDLISRQAAIDALHMHLMYRMGTDSNKKRLDDWINGVPSAQPDLDEWCTDCKEYDKDKHCCPRWNRVIREALKDAQPGKWIRHFDGNEWYWYCSSCKEQWYEEDLWMGGNSFPNFCPNCGCRMEEGDAE